MNADGSGARAVTQEEPVQINNPVWHPGGEFVLARKHVTGIRSGGSGEVWMFHVDGGGRGTMLVDKPNWQKDLGEPAVSADGRWLYYSRDTTPGVTFEYNKDANKEIFRIFRQDLRDGSVEPFVTGPGGAVRPTPSPDGKWLAFVRRVRNQSTLFVKNLSSGEERPVWGGLSRDLQESWSVYGVYPAFAWTPDAAAIVVWAQGRLWKVDPFAAMPGRAQEIPFRVQHTRELREALRLPQQVAPDRFDVRQLRWVNVSPDGSRVVYSALGRLYLKDLRDAAAAPSRVTTQDEHFEFFPSFSRDGRELVYVSWHDVRQGAVRRLELATGRETLVTREPGKYLAPRLSPDGRTVAYVKSRGGTLTSPWNGLDTGVYVTPADGRGTPQRVTRDGDTPQWGARSDELFVGRTLPPSDTEQRRSLWRIELATRQEVEVARGEFVAEFAVSPDGQWLGFTERFRAYVTPLPTIGKALTVGPRMTAWPVRRLDGDAGQGVHFSGDGRRLHWSDGDRLFSVAREQGVPVAGSEPAAAAYRAPEGTPIGFSVATDRPRGRIAVTGGTVVTMKGDEVIPDGVVVVDGHRIVAVGPAATTPVPADARRVDARGKTVIPGLIDGHWHGSMGEDQLIPQTSWVNLASLAFGVTTLHDPSNFNAHVFTQAEMQRAGVVIGPRIFSTGTILYGARTPFASPIAGLDDALGHVRRQRSAGAISVKSYNQPRRDQRQQVLEAARQSGMLVVPEGASLFPLNMGMVVDGHTTIEHALPIDTVWDDVVQLWRQTGVAYTPTLNVAYGGLDGEHYWYARTDVWQHPLLTKYVPRAALNARAVRRPTAPDEDFNVLRVARTATMLSRAGVVTNIGAHGQREGLGAHWEMWMFALGGMTPLEALRTATINPARTFGFDRDLGSLEPGKLADLVIVDGDLLADIRRSDRITHVMQNGRLFDTATMNETVSGDRRRGPLFFEGLQGFATPVHLEQFCHGHGHGEAAP
jgi:imidazolonepropionase-like amidohydrolase/Tol biopolymer transport system component